MSEFECVCVSVWVWVCVWVCECVWVLVCRYYRFFFCESVQVVLLLIQLFPSLQALVSKWCTDHDIVEVNKPSTVMLVL